MTESASSLGHEPDGAWAFDAEVARVFDDMLVRSVPQLDTMRARVFTVGRPFVRAGTTVVDLGCSRGGSLAPFVASCPGASFVGVDQSEPMLAACRARFATEIQDGTVQLLALDLRDHYPIARTSLTLAVLTLQFIRPESRARLLRCAYEQTVDGGAIIVVEKVQGSSPEVDALLTSRHEDLKRANGYSDAAIARKRLSLEGVLVPVTALRNVELLEQAGWTDIKCIWRALNFAAWIAVKA